MLHSGSDMLKLDILDHNYPGITQTVKTKMVDFSIPRLSGEIAEFLILKKTKSIQHLSHGAWSTIYHLAQTRLR